MLISRFKFNFMTSLTTVLLLKRRLLKIAKSPVLRTGGNDNSKSRYGSNYDSLIVRTVAFPIQVAYWTKRSRPPAEIVSHVKFDQWSGDMAVGSCGLVAIHA